MMKIFKFKKLSWQLTFIIGTLIILVAGSIAGYMQTVILGEINRHSQLNLSNKLNETAMESNELFMEAVFCVGAIRGYAEAIIDIGKYQRDTVSYFNEDMKPGITALIDSLIRNSPVVEAAYFALHPDLAGFPYVCDIYLVSEGDEIIEGEPQTYEEYMDVDCEDMEWFYGAYLSGAPYWTSVYLWGDTEMVSYIEPIYIDGAVVGVAGVDITLSEIQALINSIRIYDSGFALIRDSLGEFLEINSFVAGLTLDERNELSFLATSNQDDSFEISFKGIDYLASSTYLNNGYKIYILAPQNEVNADANNSLIRFTVLFIILLTIVLFIVYLISRNIAKPLNALSVYMRRAGSSGDIIYSGEEKRNLDLFIKKGGEIGQLTADCLVFIEHILHISEELGQIAEGDLTTEIEVISEKDVMGNSLNQTIENLNNMFREIYSASTLVATEAQRIRSSSGQIALITSDIAGGAQNLAKGSTSQAQAIGELTGAVHDIADKTKVNTMMADKAASLTDTVIAGAQKGTEQMDQMIKAMNEITAASREINTIIESINDISSQTNLLSLNAAIEAARAGEQGRGFAIVAGEVGKLADESTKAAHDTNLIVETSIEKAEFGAQIVSETAKSLSDIITGIRESSELIKEIAGQSNEQLSSIQKINVAIGEVSEIVAQTSAAALESAASSEEGAAAAEESTAAAEEMNRLSALLLEMGSRFKLRGE